jgi:hypothetical protein
MRSTESAYRVGNLAAPIHSVLRRCGALLALLALSACSAGGTNIAPRGSSSPTVFRDDLRPQATARSHMADNGLLFVAVSRGVWIYPLGELQKNPKSVSKITDVSPGSVAVDRNGNLYVTSSESVLRYRKGQTRFSSRIRDGIYGPTGIAVDQYDTLYVANSETETVTEYDRGDNKPSKTIHLSFKPTGLALDGSGNLYTVQCCVYSPAVWEIVAASGDVRNLNLKGLLEPFDVALDDAGDLWVTDTQADDVLIYPPNSQTPSHGIGGLLGQVGGVCGDSTGRMFIGSSSFYGLYAIQAFKLGKYVPYATLTRQLTSGSLNCAAFTPQS